MIRSGCKCARYDAAGNKILPRDAMLLYYKDDRESTEILSRSMPHRIVVVPDIEIRIVTCNPVVAILYEIYPGETKEHQIDITERTLYNLRRLYKKKTHWSVDKSKDDRVVFRRKGRVILDPLGRFGVRSKRA